MSLERFPKAKRHSWLRDGSIDITDQDKLAWVVCKYLKSGVGKQCEACPHSEIDPRICEGGFIRGCRLQAEELINIYQTGNPWRK